MKNNIAIEVKGLKKSFYSGMGASTIKNLFLNLARQNHKTIKKEHQVIKGIDLTIKTGEFVGIVGRNGMGKSTLLKLLAGIYNPDDGSIAINGSLIPFIELGVGFNPELTGRDNVYLNGALLGFSRTEMDSMYDGIVSFAELHKAMDEKLKNYSSGMQVRLAFSIAVKANSDILLLDEVLAVGDESFQNKCLREFRKFKEAKKTIILVTHSMDYIEKFCDKAILIEDGLVTKIGNPGDIAFEYKRINSEVGTTKNTKIADNETGTMGVTLSNIRITGGTNNIYKTGGSFSVKAKYKRQDINITKMNVAVGIYQEEGVYVSGVDTRADKIKSIKLRDSGQIEVSFPETVLLSGVYFINIALYEDDRENPLHFVRKSAKFTVIDNESRRGIVHMKHQWRLGD